MKAPMSVKSPKLDPADKKAYNRQYYLDHRDSPEYRSRVRATNTAWKKGELGKLSQARSNATLNGRYRSLKYAAKNKGLGFDLSKEMHADLLGRACFYCSGKLSSTGSGLDRIDNAKGYIAENVVPCCTDCNRIKCHLLTHGEMVAAMQAVLAWRLILT